MKILDKFTKEELEILLKEAKSFNTFLKSIGSSSNGMGAYSSIKNQLESLGLVIPKYIVKNNKNFIKIEDKDVFIEQSKYSRYWLKERIIKNKLIEYKCNKCGNNGQWLDEVLILQLEHINGVNNDNRLENLEFLCPNCHTQTKTYAGKKLKKVKNNEEKLIVRKRKIKYCICGEIIHRTSQRCLKCAMNSLRKVERPKFEQLVEDIKNLGYCGTGRKYGVSDNSIRKWLKKYNKNTG